MIRRAVASALAGAFAISLLDTLVTGSRAELGAGALAALCTASVGLYGAAALLAATLVAPLVWGAQGVLPAGGAAPLSTDRRLSAALLAATPCALLLVVLVAVFHLRVTSGFARKSLAAMALGIGALGFVFACTLAALPLYRLLRRLPLPAPPWVAAAQGGAVLFGAVMVLSRMDWRIINFGPWIGLALLTGFGAAHAALFHGTARGRALTARLPRWMTPVAAALWALALGWTVPRFGPPATDAALEHGLGIRALLGVARKLVDRDGDGYAALLGGGDCDDHNPAIHPGAVDIPGNGIDENCEGGDAKPTAAVEHAPAPRAQSAKAQAFRFTGNILILTIDALRVDRVTQKLMPRLHALGTESAWFENARSQAPNTPRSFPSILTSRFPSQIKWQQPTANYSNLAPGNVTFFDRLKAAGLHNFGVFSHFYFTSDRGISAPFTEWSNDGALSIRDSNHDSAAPRIVPRVIARLEHEAQSGERFALWTHLFEPHSTYVEHPEFPVHETGLRGLMEKYDGECAFVDGYIGQILDALDRTGLAKKTAVFVFADHGEAFGEHHKYFHGETIYDEVLRVPLIARVPGIAPRRIADPVMLVDLGPTLLDLIKAEPQPSFRGMSLLGPMLGDPLPAGRRVYAEMLPATAWMHHHKAMVDGPFKLLYRVSDNAVELYDLRPDAQEQHNLWGRETVRGPALKRELLEWMETELPGS